MFAGLCLTGAEGFVHGSTCWQNQWYAAGDSITKGDVVGGQSYVALAVLGSKTVKTNAGVNGSGMANAATTIIDNLVLQRCNGGNVVASELYGFNDFTVGRTEAQFLAQVASWADARRSAGVLVICTTILPSTDATAPTFNAWRNNVNTTLVTYGPGGGGTQHCDGIADFAANSLVGPDSAPNNTLYYVDKLHLTLLGQQTVAPIMQTAALVLLH